MNCEFLNPAILIFGCYKFILSFRLKVPNE